MASTRHQEQFLQSRLSSLAQASITNAGPNGTDNSDQYRAQYGPFVSTEGVNDPEHYQAVWRCMPCHREYRTVLGQYNAMSCDECFKPCLRAPNELIRAAQLASNADEAATQHFIDNSDSSTTLTMQVINDAPIRTPSVPQP